MKHYPIKNPEVLNQKTSCLGYRVSFNERELVNRIISANDDTANHSELLRKLIKNEARRLELA